MNRIFHMKNTEHDADETEEIILIIPETFFIHCQCSSSIIETIHSNHLKTDNLLRILSNKSRNHNPLYMFNKDIERMSANLQAL